jgi:hypothetical protein
MAQLHGYTAHVTLKALHCKKTTLKNSVITRILECDLRAQGYGGAKQKR